MVVRTEWREGTHFRCELIVHLVPCAAVHDVHESPEFFTPDRNHCTAVHDKLKALLHLTVELGPPKNKKRRREMVTVSSLPLSLAGAATSIIFITTKVLSRQTCAYHNKTHLLSWQKYACHDKTFVVFNLLRATAVTRGWNRYRN